MHFLEEILGPALFPAVDLEDICSGVATVTEQGYVIFDPAPLGFDPMGEKLARYHTEQCGDLGGHIKDGRVHLPVDSALRYQNRLPFCVGTRNGDWIVITTLSDVKRISESLYVILKRHLPERYTVPPLSSDDFARIIDAHEENELRLKRMTAIANDFRWGGKIKIIPLLDGEVRLVGFHFRASRMGGIWQIDPGNKGENTDLEQLDKLLELWNGELEMI